uniref:Uncharacterized protein n=1 Tax=Oryza nivara TaxID=4536 RepID=A0A0E0GRQ3_ORYNI
MTRDRMATRSHTPESGGTSEQPHAAVAALEYALCVNGKPCARPRVDGSPATDRCRASMRSPALDCVSSMGSRAFGRAWGNGVGGRASGT